MPIMVCSPDLAKYLQKWPSEDFELLVWFVEFHFEMHGSCKKKECSRVLVYLSIE